MIDYVVQVAILIGIFTVLAVSYDLLIGRAGLFSIAHAAFYGIGAYATSILALDHGLNLWLAIVGGVLAAGLLSLAVAVPALRVSGIYLVVTSFAFQMIVVAVLINWGDVTGGPSGLFGIARPKLLGPQGGDEVQFLVATVILASVLTWFFWALNRSPYGRSLLTVRDDQVGALAAGKDIRLLKLSAFAIASAIAGLAGAWYAYYIGFISPSSFTVDESVFIAAIVVIGGAGTIKGPVLGAVVLVGVPEMLRFWDVGGGDAFTIRQLIYGALLVLFMIWRPQGLLGKPLVPERGGS